MKILKCLKINEDENTLFQNLYNVALRGKFIAMNTYNLKTSIQNKPNITPQETIKEPMHLQPKEARACDAEKAVPSISGAGKTGELRVRE